MLLRPDLASVFFYFPIDSIDHLGRIFFAGQANQSWRRIGSGMALHPEAKRGPKTVARSFADAAAAVAATTTVDSRFGWVIRERKCCKNHKNWRVYDSKMVRQCLCNVFWNSFEYMGLDQPLVSKAWDLGRLG